MHKIFQIVKKQMNDFFLIHIYWEYCMNLYSTDEMVGIMRLAYDCGDILEFDRGVYTLGQIDP